MTVLVQPRKLPCCLGISEKGWIPGRRFSGLPSTNAASLARFPQSLSCPSSPPPFPPSSLRSSLDSNRKIAPSVGSIRRRRTNRHFSLLVYTDKIWEGMWLQPRIRREIVPVEEHLSSDGVREPEGRSDREDIEIVGRVTDIDATKYDDLLLLLGVLLTINFSDRTTVPRVILFTATST